MNDFNRCNKVTGVYWLKDPVDNIKITVKLKPKVSILSLPKFEEYSNEAHENVQHDKIQTYKFKWQEKVFCNRELQQYTDVHNCITDTELTYHNMITESHYEPCNVFTYLHDEGYLPFPNRSISDDNGILNLSYCMKKLRLNESNSMGHLFRSEEDISDEQWSAMHIMLDNSEYNEDSQLLLKQEATLISLYHNITHNYIILSPDINNLEMNPYSVETTTGIPLEYQYGIDVDFQERGSSDELVTLLQKLCKKWEKKHRNLVNFNMSPLGKRQVCVTVHIADGSGFEMDDLYVEYDIRIPEGVQCDGVLHGRTHTSRGLFADDVDTWCFAYIIELVLEMDIGFEPPPLQLFFEVISTDWWGRQRTEGYSYLPLTLTPGRYEKQLSCSRPEEIDRVHAESRRFFVGGCHLIKDLHVLAKPQLQDANFSYITTGTLSINWDVIIQTPIPGATPQPTTSSASALLLGAEAVLRQYRKAKAKLAAATRDYDVMEGDGDG